MRIWHTTAGRQHPGYYWIVTIEGFRGELERIETHCAEYVRYPYKPGDLSYNRDVFIPEHGCYCGQYVQDFHFKAKWDAIMFALNNDKDGPRP